MLSFQIFLKLYNREQLFANCHLFVILFLLNYSYGRTLIIITFSGDIFSERKSEREREREKETKRNSEIDSERLRETEKDRERSNETKWETMERHKETESETD